MSRRELWIGVAVLGALCLALSADLVQAQDSVGGPGPQGPLGTAFTYQGQLRQAGIPVTAVCDVRFILYDADIGGSQVGPTQERPGLSIQAGLFTVTDLDFGETSFRGQARWLEVAVRCPSAAGVYITLSPRQKLTATPYALFARNVPWAGLKDVPPGFADSIDDDTLAILACAAGQVPKWNGTTWACADDQDTTYSAGTGLILAGTTFAADVSYLQRRVSGVCPAGQAIRVVNSDGAVTCQAVGGTANAWLLNGNAGTAAGPNFLGTTDNQALELKVNSTRVVRLEPNASSPNVIEGYSGNTVVAGAYGAAIGGGGTDLGENQVTANYGTIGGGLKNAVTASEATVAGGSFNKAGGGTATVGGGGANEARALAATVAGGAGNLASGERSAVGGGTGNAAQGVHATVGGGQSNVASGLHATIGGGLQNQSAGMSATVGGGDTNTATGEMAAIGGGEHNAASNDRATVGGGGQNTATGSSSTVAGGFANQASGYMATVGGGDSHVASGSWALVAGGYSNRATAEDATVGGGEQNLASGDRAVVTGGARNVASGGTSTVAGGRQNVALASDASISGGWGNSATGDASAIGGGRTNKATALLTTVGGGEANQATGDGSTISGGGSNIATSNNGTVGGGLRNKAISEFVTIGGGVENTASAFYSTVPGGTRAVASSWGQMAYASGSLTKDGDAQTSAYVLRNITEGITTTELYLDGAVQRIAVATGQAMTFDVLVVARTAAGVSAGYRGQGVIENVGGTTTLVAPVMMTVLGEDDPAWDCLVAADNVNDALVIKAIGSAGVQVRWVATVRTAEVSW